MLIFTASKTLMAQEPHKILKHFNFKKIIIPVIIGIGVAAYLIFQSFDIEVFKNTHWTWITTFWIFVAMLLMVVRHLAYMYRIRLLTDKRINWKHSFQVIMLWEFASSITPSVVGGSAVAFYIVNKEGVNMGRTTAVVLVTSLLDELFYIIFVPIVIITAGFNNIFVKDTDFSIFNMDVGMFGIFLAGYLFIILLQSIIVYGIFVNPRGLKWILIRIFKLRFLRKWLSGAVTTGDQIITTSRELKGKSIIFWAKAFISTVFSWTARFWVVNAMILGFVSVQDHLLIYARQLVMWVIMLISPTPGSSGVAEYIFTDFLGEFIPLGLSPALALLWRLLSFYPYIIVGAIVLPIWIRRVYGLNKKDQVPSK